MCEVQKTALLGGCWGINMMMEVTRRRKVRNLKPLPPKLATMGRHCVCENQLLISLKEGWFWCIPTCIRQLIFWQKNMLLVERDERDMQLCFFARVHELVLAHHQNHHGFPEELLQSQDPSLTTRLSIPFSSTTAKCKDGLVGAGSIHR